MERRRDWNRPAIAAPGEGGGAGVISSLFRWNASATSGLPRAMQVKMPKIRPIGQAGDQGTMAAMAAVATTGNPRSRRIMIAAVINKADRGTIGTAPEVTVGQNQLG